jgi:hypothetical protein
MSIFWTLSYNVPDFAHSIVIISGRKEKVEQLETRSLDMLGEEAE